MRQKKPKIFYGYWILVAAFLCVFFMSGTGFYAFSLFIKPLTIDFDWARGNIMAGITVFYIITALASPFAGRIFDHYGARRTVALGALISGLGFIWLALMSDLWHFYFAWALIGIGIAGSGQIPASAVVSNWFKKRRGMAIGIMSTGVGVGGFTFASFVGGYLIPTFAWRNSYLAIAILTFIVLIPISLFVLKTRPSDKGIHPEGIRATDIPSTETSNISVPELNLRKALKTLPFWLIVVSFCLHGFSMGGVFHSQVPYMQDIQFPDTTAATILGIVGIGSGIGKFGFGWLCDHIKAKYACSIGIGLQIIGLVLLFNITTTFAWLYAVIMGIGIGAYLPTMSMLTSSHFGLKHYGTIFGVITFSYFFGNGLGPLMAGYLHDTTNNYSTSFIIFLALYVIALIVIMMTRKPKSDNVALQINRASR